MKKQLAITVLAVSFSMAAGADSLSGNASGKAGVGVQGQAQFKDLDTNGDGVISKEEAQGHSQISSKFSDLDKNRNGKLEQGEFARFETAPRDGTSAPSGADRDRMLDRNADPMNRGDGTGSTTRPNTGGMN